MSSNRYDCLFIYICGFEDRVMIVSRKSGEFELNFFRADQR